MRIDRIVTLLASRALGSLATAPGAQRLPVLMYHSISSPQEATTPYYQTATHPATFAAQMQALEGEGYVGVTLSQGLKAISSALRYPSGRRPVAITFDDGYRDFLTAAVPVLRRHGFKATMYLPTGFIGQRRRAFKNRECLTWREVSDLHADAFEFGSHTVTHPRLMDLTWDEIRSELLQSKQAIEHQLQIEVTTFAYPYAFPQQHKSFVERFVDLLGSFGYQSGVTTTIGRVRPTDDTLTLKRLPINSADDTALLLAKLGGFYDWMTMPQLAVKQLKRLQGHRGA